MSELNQEFLEKLLSGQFSTENEPGNVSDNEMYIKQAKPESSNDVSLPILKHDAELVELPISLLVDYPNQPLPPYSEEEMTELVGSIRENGVITPLLVRPYNEGFQIIDGRNRRNGAQSAGYISVPCIVRNLSDDEAAIYLVESIFRQRDMSKVSLMQKAHAYRLWLDAMKRQGRRNDLTSRHIDAKSRSDEIIADNVPESARTIQRMIRLTYLVPELQSKVEGSQGLFPFLAAVLASYMAEDIQLAVYQYFFVDHDYGISIKTAERLRDECNANVILSQEHLQAVWNELNGEKSAVPGKVKKLVLPTKELNSFYKAGYFKENTTEKEMLATIREWAEFYHRNKMA